MGIGIGLMEIHILYNVTSFYYRWKYPVLVWGFALIPIYLKYDNIILCNKKVWNTRNLGVCSATHIMFDDQSW